MRDFRLENNIDLFLFTESWLKNDDHIEIAELENEDCYLLHTPRPHRGGGGVASLIKSDVIAKKSNGNTSKTFEHMTINLELHGKKIMLVLLYRPEPSNKNKYTMSEFFDEFTNLLATLHQLKTEIIIAGDFNIHINKKDDPRTIRLNSILEMFDLVQHISTPTHRGGNTLDLVISHKDSTLVADCTIDDLNSDHNCILFKLYLPNSRKKKIKKITFRKTKSIIMTNFAKDIGNKLPESKLRNNSLNQLVQLYNSTTEVLDKHAPLTVKNVTQRQPTPWVNEDIKNLKAAKRKAEKRWRKSKLTSDWEAFKQKRNALNSTLSNLRSANLTNKIQKTKGNSKAMFKVLNASLNRKQDLPLPCHDDPKTLANEFNKFFDDKIQKIRLKLSTVNPIPNRVIAEPQIDSEVRPLSEFKPLSNEEIGKLIISMPTKHCGLDPIPTWLLKDNINQFLPILTKIVNLSMRSGMMPEQLKNAIVRPLLKKPGLELEKKNYRPVSNLPFLGKLIEGAVIKQYSEHLKTNELDDQKQSAYKKYHSTETLLIKIHDSIMKNLAEGQITLLTLLDLSAAFDTIDHNILLERLKYRYKIEGTALSWFKSYLSDRTQSVIVNDTLSDSLRLNQGVPQGSKLGPILFNSYIAPLSQIAKSNQVEDEKYADDEQLLLSFKPKQIGAQLEAINRIEKCICEIRDFLHSNMLCNNNEKTEFLIIGTQAALKMLQLDSIKIDNVMIKAVSDVRNLGVIFDKHMTMEKQVNKMCRNAYFNIRNLAKIRNCLDTETTKTAVHALVTPHLDYGNALLTGISKRSENKLQIAQNSAVRLVKRINKMERVTQHRKELHWLPINARIQFKILMTVWKALHGQAPAYLINLLQKKNNQNLYLRSNDQLLLKPPDLFTSNKYGDRAFSVVGPKLWNQLPLNIRNINTLECFKSNLKTHLFKVSYP